MRYLKQEKIAGEVGLYYVEIAGVSSETKPEAGIATGSIFTEVNTGKVYFFNEAGSAGSKWVEQFSFIQE